jgi:hypothetical protein
MRELCPHCGKNLAQKSRGGICDPCYRIPRIRRMYKKDRPAGKPRGEAKKQETMEDLERQIAEREPTMPERVHDMAEPERLRKKSAVRILPCGRRWNGSIIQ